MEVETLMMDLQRRFQLDDAEFFEMTLGEVVELMKPVTLSKESLGKRPT